jgi:hypothetical protein
MCGEPFPSVELACGRGKEIEAEDFSMRFGPGSIVPLFWCQWSPQLVLHCLGLGLPHWAANRETFQVPRGQRAQAGDQCGGP